MKRQDLIRSLEDLGYRLSRIAGSHMIFCHPRSIKPVILLHNSKNKDFGPSFVRRLLRQAEDQLTLPIAA